MSPALRITSKRDGFRRAGVAHAAAATLHPAGRFTAEEARALLADPMLVVEVVDAEPKAALPPQAGVSAETLNALTRDILGQVHLVAEDSQAAPGGGEQPATDGAAQTAGPVALPIAGDAGGTSPAPMPEGEARSVSPAPAAVAGPEEGAGQQPAAAVTAAATPAAGATAAPVVQPATKPKKPKA